MPMMRMSMYDQGIELYCTPTADDRETWISTVKHIALEGRCFVFSSCQFFTKADYPSEFDISNIVDESGLSRSTVYKILKKLEDNNLVEALQSKLDKRESIVSLKV